MANAVNGKNLMLYWHRTDVSPAVDVPIACSTNCTFTVDVEQKEVTSITSAWFREYKNDLASWNITADGLIILNGFSYLFFMQKQLDRSPIEINLVIDNGVDGLVIINGVTNISNFSFNGPVRDAATYNISLQGTGPYGITGTSITPAGIIIRGGYVYNKEYTAAGGETTITWTDMIGKDCVYVSRGGIDVQRILTTGTPIEEQVKWNSVTGVLTFARALESTEFVRGLFN
jgi:predicted secreted protein